MSGNNRFYVVYRGRRVGIFDNWSECNRQTEGFRGASHQSFPTFQLADRAWKSWEARNNASPTEFRFKQKPKQSSPNSASASQSSAQHHSLDSFSVSDMQQALLDIEEPPNPTDFLVQYSTQSILITVCENLDLPPPTWSLHETKCEEGLFYYKYSVSVSCDPTGPPVVKVGKFAACHAIARDSVSLMMLRFIETKFGKTVKDYNYYHVKEMEQMFNVRDEHMRFMARRLDNVAAENRKMKSVARPV